MNFITNIGDKIVNQWKKGGIDRAALIVKAISILVIIACTVGILTGKFFLILFLFPAVVVFSVVDVIARIMQHFSGNNLLNNDSETENNETVLVSTKRKKCSCCDEEVDEIVAVCPNCGSNTFTNPY